MHIIKVRLRKRSYNIITGRNIIRFLPKFISRLNIGRDAYVITNRVIKNKYGEILNKVLKDKGFKIKFKLVPDGEQSKSLEMAYAVIKDIASYDTQKRMFIIAWGGGVIGDLAGFIASIYKRGIPYIQVPTTLLAQVDSSIGGKTAVDLRQGKNLVGAFYQPRLVFSDAEFLKTLSIRQLRSGLAEVIKYGLIKDSSLFAYLEKKYQAILGFKPSVLEFIARRSSSIKAGIVQRDEKEEKGIRTVLNFGHTIGHAVEAAGNYRGYNHGEAIAIGMLAACDISKNLGFINNLTLQRIERLMKAVGLPTTIKVSLSDTIKAYYHDKKFIGKRNKFVLLKDIGQAKIVEGIPLKTIKEVLKKRSQIISW